LPLWEDLLVDTTENNKRCCHRRRFLAATAAGAGAVAAGQSFRPFVIAGERPKQRIKIGQIGTGHEHASGKMETFRKLAEHYDVVGIVEADPQRRKKCENTAIYRGVKWMTEEELFNTKGLKAVTVETVVPDLVPTAARCIDAGMHIHLDKPGGEMIGPFKKLLDEAGRRGLTVQLGYIYRNNPAVQFCFRAVREGWLGQIFEVHAVMSRKDSVNYRTWLGQFRGGAMYNFGCHIIDLVVSLLGKPDRVTSCLRQTESDVKVNDNCLAVFEYPRATATVRTTVVEVEGYQRRQLVVCGDQGTIDIRPLEAFATRPKEPVKLQMALAVPRDSYQKGYQEIAFPVKVGRYDEQLIELAHIIRGEIANPYPLAHELLVQETLLAACGIPAE
jgi:predicted dehydrogenase